MILGIVGLEELREAQVRTVSPTPPLEHLGHGSEWAWLPRGPRPPGLCGSGQLPSLPLSSPPFSHQQDGRSTSLSGRREIGWKIPEDPGRWKQAPETLDCPLGLRPLLCSLEAARQRPWRCLHPEGGEQWGVGVLREEQTQSLEPDTTVCRVSCGLPPGLCSHLPDKGVQWDSPCRVKTLRLGGQVMLQVCAWVPQILSGWGGDLLWGC